MIKYLIIDTGSTFKIENNILYIDIKNSKVDFNKLFKNIEILCFENVKDIVSTNIKNKINNISKIKLGDTFNPHTTFDFINKFPDLKQIICKNKECFDVLKEIYSTNKKIRILYQPTEINYC